MAQAQYSSPLELRQEDPEFKVSLTRLHNKGLPQKTNKTLKIRKSELVWRSKRGGGEGSGRWRLGVGWGWSSMVVLVQSKDAALGCNTEKQSRSEGQANSTKDSFLLFPHECIHV